MCPCALRWKLCCLFQQRPYSAGLYVLHVYSWFLAWSTFSIEKVLHAKSHEASKAWSIKSMKAWSMKSPAEHSLHLHTSCYLRKGSMRCATTQFDQILSFLNFSATEQWGIWSDCTKMFASLNLPPFDPCNRVAAQLFLIYIFVASLYIIYIIYILFI